MNQPYFPEAEFSGRLERLRRRMRQRGVEAALVTSPENICYLTGHATPGYYTYQCLVVPEAGNPILLLRESEAINAQEGTYLIDIRGYTDASNPMDLTVEVFHQLKAEKIGVEERSWFFTPYQYRQLEQQLPAADLVAVDGDLGELRLVKSEAEIAEIRRAAVIVNAAATAAAAVIRPGVSERQIAARIFSALIEAGSEHLGMEPFVASGPRSGAIHASWSDRKIEDGEPVLIEVAASRSRYHAALMHTVEVGRLPADLQAMADTCRAALAATVETIRPGITPAECHRACTEVIKGAGLSEFYRKRTGYSIGLAFAPDWGEGHLLSLGDNQTRPLERGMVVHVVPAIRKPGRGGFGTSSTVLVTGNGREVLTGLSSHPI